MPYLVIHPEPRDVTFKVAMIPVGPVWVALVEHRQQLHVALIHCSSRVNSRAAENGDLNLLVVCLKARGTC